MIRLGFIFAISLFYVFSSATVKGEERPNILFAISDDQAWQHTSVYGYEAISTPNFDRIAKQGVLFNNSITGSPGCTPSRSSVLTGRYPWQLEQAGTHASSFPAKFAVYPDLLEETGYFVGYTGKGWGPGNYKTSGRTRNPAGPSFSSKKLKEKPAKGIASTDYAGNFADFMSKRPADKPFCFWFGGHEPHRSFEKGSGLVHGLKLEKVDVPKFLPDTEEIRNDILDYCLEIQWFDTHLGQMIVLLEKNGELDNTIIVVTSDNGMAFPRAKANVYEHGIHMPLAISWGNKIKGNRIVDDLVSHTDLAPTFLEAAGVTHPSAEDDTPAMTGRSLLPLLLSDKSGTTSFARDHQYSSRERHSSSRWNNNTYPQRCVRTDTFLLIRNFKPERWPAGTPQKLDGKGNLGPMHGGYHDIDACPSLTFLIENRNDSKIGYYFHLSVDHRPEYELFNIRKDQSCLENLAGSTSHAKVFSKLKENLNGYLKETGDPRLLGNGDIWDSYIRYSQIRKFPKPEWAD
ncbi:MAG: sulfatase family protein [Pirellulales bacterium]